MIWNFVQKTLCSSVVIKWSVLLNGLWINFALGQHEEQTKGDPSQLRSQLSPGGRPQSGLDSRDAKQCVVRRLRVTPDAKVQRKNRRRSVGRKGTSPLQSRQSRWRSSGRFLPRSRKVSSGGARASRGCVSPVLRLRQVLFAGQSWSGLIWDRTWVILGGGGGKGKFKGVNSDQVWV